MSGQDNRRDVEKRESQRTVISGNIWECTVNLSLGVTSSFLHGIVLLTAPSRPLKLQPATDQILVIKSADQLTVVELTVFAFMAPFEVNATLIIGQGPVCRIVIRVMWFPLALFP